MVDLDSPSSWRCMLPRACRVRHKSSFSRTETSVFPILYSKQVSMKTSNNISRSLGPPMCSGWNWMLKNGRLSCTIPSLVLSFAFVKRIDQSAGRVSESTAKPWFCVVMKQRWEVECTQGWLWPRLPYLSMGRRKERRKKRERREQKREEVRIVWQYISP